MELVRWPEAGSLAPQYDGKCSFYFNCYFFRTTPTNQDLRHKAVYFQSRCVTELLIMEIWVFFSDLLTGTVA